MALSTAALRNTLQLLQPAPRRSVRKRSQNLSPKAEAFTFADELGPYFAKTVQVPWGGCSITYITVPPSVTIRVGDIFTSTGELRETDTCDGPRSRTYGSRSETVNTSRGEAGGTLILSSRVPFSSLLLSIVDSKLCPKASS